MGRGASPGRPDDKGMADVIFVLATVLFFAVAAAYVVACDRLQ
jgi:hypothetical protein